MQKFYDTDFYNADKAVVEIRGEVAVTDKEPYYHKNIKIQKCEFTSDMPVSGGYADNIVFTGNKNTSGEKMRMELTNCGRVIADNCEIIRKTEENRELKLN